MSREIIANAGMVVRDKLVARFGVRKLWQIERLSANIFRAWLTDGGVAIAIVQRDGSVKIDELEEAC